MTLDYLEELYFKAIKNTAKSTDFAVADRYLNVAYKEIFLSHNWIYRKRTGQLTLIPRYTTGTCSVTKFDGTNEAASKTVTFAGASLSTNMRGRYLRVQDSDKWYRILYLTGSGTSWTAYLDAPVTDVSSGTKTFEIWNRFYYVNSDAAEILDFGRWENGRLEYNPDLLDRYTDISKESDTPSSFNAHSVDPFSDITEDATISIPAESNVGTVSGLNMLSSGYNAGDIASISNVDYYIKRVESDTRVIFFNYFQDVVASGTSVTFSKNNPIGIEFYNPVDDYDSVPYDYLGYAYDLVHRTKDKILLPNNFIPAIVSRAHYYAMKDAHDERYLQMLDIYDLEMKGLKQKVHVVKPRYTKFSPAISKVAPGRG